MTISEKIKTYWPVCTAFIVMSGMVAGGIGYYARVEAKELIEKEMAEPVRSLRNKTDEIDKSVNSLKLQIERNHNQVETLDTKIQGTNDRLDLVIELLKKK